MINKFNFIFSGASISAGPWDTWADYTIKEFKISNYYRNAYAGVGNEFITLSTIHKIKKTKNPFVVVMFTNIDKWDWYIDNENISRKINDNEKHIVRNLDGNIDYHGFWCTGSWFPEYKEYYKELYYSQEYFLHESLKNIWTLQSFCKSKNIPCLILFDSPILETTEQNLNNQNVEKLKLTGNMLSNLWEDMVDWDNIYKPGLIGYCVKNRLPWYDSKIKGHPPTDSHKRFFDDVVKEQMIKLLK